MTDVTSTDPFGYALDSGAAAPHDGGEDALRWRDLSRQTRKAMSRLLGGGTLRGTPPETVLELRRFGLIEGRDEQFSSLTEAGWAMLRSSREWLRTAPTRAGVRNVMDEG